MLYILDSNSLSLQVLKNIFSLWLDFIFFNDVF